MEIECCWRRLDFEYTNYRGEISNRRVFPQRIYWGSTEYHPEPQLLLRAYDIDKEEYRDFSLKDIRPIPTKEVPSD